jgi:hypothetical protein
MRALILKRILATVLLFAIAIISYPSVDAFAQDLSDDIFTDVTIQDKKSASKIIANTNYFSLAPFKFLDGTTLSYKKIRPLLANIPENEKLLKEITNTTLLNWISVALFAASSVGFYAYYRDEGATYRNTMLPITAFSSATFLITGIISNQALIRSRQRAVDNYNLYIMGIPIPH